MTSQILTAAIDSFANPRGYLATASVGLPPRQTLEALTADQDEWARGALAPQDYDLVVDRTRASYAHMVGLDPDRVAQGSQASVMTSIVAAGVPTGAEVLCVEGDFTSILFPFMQRADLVVRHVPLSALADSVTENTWLVVFALVQSANGQVADIPAILEAAHRHGARTFCDLTQSAGVFPIDASQFDASVCHAYKWLCAPRGVGFLGLSEDFDALLTPLQAGWYAGDEIWQSVYGPHMTLASTARRFDVSPAWQAWAGAEASIALFAGLDIAEVWELTSGLGDALCDALGIRQQHQAIVTWPDGSGRDLSKLTAAGIRASGRAGRLRASLHIWNDLSDVDAVAVALRG